MKILLAGLAKSGIPYQSRVPPSEALPETETVELFIGTKPAQPEPPAPTAGLALGAGELLSENVSGS